MWISEDACLIEAKPSEIWPWLCQMGTGRAGWYSYDWIDNLGKSSFKHLDADLVRISKGQDISFAVIDDFREPEFLSYRFGAKARMEYHLHAEGTGTRLMTRVLIDTSPVWSGISSSLFEPLHLFMQREQFRGLRKRVEKNR